MSRYKITKHGDMYVNKHEPILCPECASEIIKSDYKSEVDDVFFRLIKRTRTYSCLICNECGCEMQKLKKIQIKPYRLFWKILLSTLFNSLTIFTGWFTVYAIIHDGNCETWIGTVGAITFFITLFMVILDIYYIGDILEYSQIYKEY